MSQRRYGLYGEHSRDFLTVGGRILWHDDQHELEFLVRGDAKAREIPRDIPDEQMLSIKDHPNFAAIQWPITRRQFKRPTSVAAVLSGRSAP